MNTFKLDLLVEAKRELLKLLLFLQKSTNPKN